MGWIETLKQRAHALQSDTYALYLAYRHPQVPWYAKVWAALVVAYAFSPIDLVPDFIPVLGYLDDIILIPLGVGIAVKLIPPDVLAECRQNAAQALSQQRPGRWQGALIVAVLWLLGLVVVGFIIFRAIQAG